MSYTKEMLKAAMKYENDLVFGTKFDRNEYERLQQDKERYLSQMYPQNDEPEKVDTEPVSDCAGKGIHALFSGTDGLESILGGSGGNA